ncbi:hypothetical protein N0V88_003664 [Collariella sp. IMI 366227]|nr:hypothetical protein N0V88_003664 [Collariella sp. IMI 366227]
MEYHAEESSSRESSPLSTPPESTPGSPQSTPHTSPSLNTPISQSDLVIELNIPPPRTSHRLAAQRAQTAIKRVFEDTNANTGEEAHKRTCLRTNPDTEPESPQSIIDHGVLHDSQESAMQAVLKTMAAASKLKSATGNTDVAPRTVSVRPQPSGQPVVWAKGRGSLCEALPYFKAYKGSLHSANVVAQGFLIDSEAEEGDVFGEQVIISSVGGGRVKDPKSGTMIRAKDANDNATNVRAFMAAHCHKEPIAIIAGEGHPLYPCQPPHPYAVLGYFHITDMWKQKVIPRGASKSVSIWRIRFEKANLAQPSWWTPQGATRPGPVTETQATVVPCGKCNTKGKQLFTIGWFCLNHKCEHYFTFPDGTLVDLEGLTYTEGFLNERTHYARQVPSIIPPVLDPTGMHGTELALRQGFVCPSCGCCNRRVYWNRWVCENPACNYTRNAPMQPYHAAFLKEENTKFEMRMQTRRETWGVNHNPLGLANYPIDPFATIYHRGYLEYSQTLVLGGFQVRQYFLPDSQGQILGSFTIFSASDEVNCRPNGPDDLFRSLERTDIGLRRNPSAVVGHKLEGYTRHFQQNFGARYKFGVSVQSKGFEEAPDVILRALQRLAWAKEVAVTNANKLIATLDAGKVWPSAVVPRDGDFNELLALGYMEKDRINYHDDGESELGPVVAALSLGSPSTMRFRPKRKTGFWLPMHQENGKPTYKEILEVTMKHGDMMVMAGADIQKTYEVRNFTLTKARYIDPEKMTLQSDRDDAMIRGTIPDHAKDFIYDGF